MSSRRPDAATSSGLVVKDEPADDDDHRVPPDDDDDDDDDPIVRTIDVYISPALSNTLHLLQFPIEPARRRRQHHHGGRGGGGGIDKDDEDDDDDVPSPTEARFRPRHNMLELDYPLPQFRRDLRRLPPNVATMMTTRTHSSNSVAPNTHLALARLDDSGSRMHVVPLIRHALQMRPSFAHLDDVDGDGDGGGVGDGDGEGGHDGTTTTTTGIVAADRRPDDDRGTNVAPVQRRRPIMFATREGSTTEFQHPGGAGGGRRAPHAQKRASEAAEGWIVLDVARGGGGGADDGGKRTTSFGRETSSSFRTRRGEGNGEDRAPMGLAGYDDDDDDEDDDCADVPYSADDDGGCDECGARYVRSLNYLDSYPSGRGGGGSGGATPPSGGALVEDPWEWSPPNAPHEYDDSADHVDASEAGGVGATERAAAELAARLAAMMQSGNGTMIPYCVLRSQFHPTRVPDELLTVALSSCAVLVRGNFALKSTLAKFLAANGGGEGRKKSKSMRELRDLILLLLNMHGMVQRERLARAYSSRGGGERRRRTDGGYDPIIDPDTITFVLKTVARKSHHCWVAKVDDDEEFAAKFPEVAACHAIYWMKKKEMLADLIELYENVGGGGQEC